MPSPGDTVRGFFFARTAKSITHNSLCFLLFLVSLFADPSLVQSQTALINSNLVVSGNINTCTDSGTVNAYACTLDRTLTQYEARTCYGFLANSTNTGAATVNFSSVGGSPMGAKAIVKMAGGITTPLIANDIRTGQLVHVCYDGTNMQMMSQPGNAPSGSGTVNTDTLGEAAYYTGGTAVSGSAGFLLDGTSVVRRVEKVTESSGSLTLATHNVIACDASAAARTYTLPAASGQTLGQIYRVIKIDANTSNACSVQTTGGERLNGIPNTTKSTTTQFEDIEVILVSITTPNWQVSGSVVAPVSVPLGGTGATTLTGLVLGNGAVPMTTVTTSAGIFGAISDRTGSGGALVFATRPDLLLQDSTATFQDNADLTKQARFQLSGLATGQTREYAWPDVNGSSTVVVLDAAQTYGDGFKQTFNPNGTSAGLNVGSQAGDPSTLGNGDLWYNDSTNELRARINGGSVTLGAPGAGTGDVDAVNITATAPLTGTTTCGSGTCAFTLGVSAGSTTGAGVVELADTGETTTGSSTALAITPGGLTASTMVRSIYIPAGSMDVSGACAVNASAVLLTNGPKLPTISCTDNNADSIEFDWVMPDGYVAASTVTVQLSVFSTGNNTTEIFAMHCAGQAVSSGDSPTAHSTTGEQIASITWGNTANREQQATTAPITIQGTPAAGDHIYMRCQVDAGTTTLNPMSDGKILGAKVEYTRVRGND